jgi:hypothetical protein
MSYRDVMCRLSSPIYSPVCTMCGFVFVTIHPQFPISKFEPMFCLNAYLTEYVSSLFEVFDPSTVYIGTVDRCTYRTWLGVWSTMRTSWTVAHSFSVVVANGTHDLRSFISTLHCLIRFNFFLL